MYQEEKSDEVLLWLDTQDNIYMTYAELSQYYYSNNIIHDYEWIESVSWYWIKVVYA